MDVVSQAVRPLPLQHVRRQTTHVERPEQVEHVAPVGVVGYSERGRSAVVDADAEPLVVELTQFEQVPQTVVHSVSAWPCSVAAAVVHTDPQSTTTQLHQEEVRRGAFVVRQQCVSNLNKTVRLPRSYAIRYDMQIF